jgi:ureidoacrylate peracid hydrolase
VGNTEIISPRIDALRRVLEAGHVIALQGDEIVLPKSSPNVFVSTTLDYVLRNLGVRQLIVRGLLTDQCVESAVRNACDLGYLVTLVTDACATHSPEQHENSLQASRGFCRQVTTDQVLAELASWLAYSSLPPNVANDRGTGL